MRGLKDGWCRNFSSLEAYIPSYSQIFSNPLKIGKGITAKNRLPSLKSLSLIKYKYLTWDIRPKIRVFKHIIHKQTNPGI